jgi:rubrerythrin
MHDMTAAHLRSAYGGECMANMRYRIWADKAEQEGYPNVARLFRGISFAEQVHATNHFTQLRDQRGGALGASMAEYGLRSTSDNLEGAIGGEIFEVNEMYPVYLEAAKLQKETGAFKSFHYALSTEKIHAAMFQCAKAAVGKGSDMKLGPVRVCNVCGWTAEGEIPDKCPLCQATRDKFTTFA